MNIEVGMHVVLDRNSDAYQKFLLFIGENVANSVFVVHEVIGDYIKIGTDFSSHLVNIDEVMEVDIEDDLKTTDPIVGFEMDVFNSYSDYYDTSDPNNTGEVTIQKSEYDLLNKVVNYFLSGGEK